MSRRAAASTPFTPAVREVATILGGLPTSRTRSTTLKAILERLRGRAAPGYLSVLRTLSRTHELAADFVLLTGRRLAAENSGRDCPDVGLGMEWWLFGTSGRGDGWLLRCDPASPDVAFLDQDQESRAVAKPLGITFDQWLQTADLLAQVERATDLDPTLCDERFRLRPGPRKAVRAQLARIEPALRTTLPFIP